MTVLSCIYKKRQSVSWLAKLWHFFLKKFELTPRPPTAWPKSYICWKVFVSQVKPTLSPEVNPKMVLSASFVCDRGWRHEVSSVRKSKSYASPQKSQADLHNLGTKSFPKANAAHVCPTANFCCWYVNLVSFQETKVYEFSSSPKTTGRGLTQNGDEHQVLPQKFEGMLWKVRPSINIRSPPANKTKSPEGAGGSNPVEMRMAESKSIKVTEAMKDGLNSGEDNWHWTLILLALRLNLTNFIKDYRWTFRNGFLAILVFGIFVCTGDSVPGFIFNRSIGR